MNRTVKWIIAVSATLLVVGCCGIFMIGLAYTYFNWDKVQALTQAAPVTEKAPAEIKNTDSGNDIAKEGDGQAEEPAVKEKPAAADAPKAVVNEPPTPLVKNDEAVPAAADVQLCADLRSQMAKGDADDIKPVRQGLPAKTDPRDHVLVGGAVSHVFMVFGNDYPNVTINRAIGDDIMTQVTYCTPDNTAYDLLPSLGMTWVTTDTLSTMDPNLVLIMRSRGVDTKSGEILMQNMYGINLGQVQTGSFIYALSADDPKLQVNDGVFLSVVGDNTYFDRDLEGAFLPIDKLTFFPSAEVFGNTIDEEAYAAYVASPPSNKP